MKHSRRSFAATLAATLMLFAGSGPNAHAAEATIKIGTLAPAASPWGQVFKIWEKAVHDRSGGRLELQFFYSGQQGDEGDMVGKMKSGQLDAAALTAVGLSVIHKPILALQMPGLFTNWTKLEQARDALTPEFTKGLSDAGFTFVGWGDVGEIHLVSKGFAIRTPEDFKGKKPYMWREDIVQPSLFAAIGGVTPVPLNVPEVLPALNTGAINCIATASLAAEQLQWASKFDHVGEDTAGLLIGALLVASKKMESLPPDLRQIFLDTGKLAASALTKRIRDEDAAAFERMKGKMTVVKLSPDEVAKWKALFEETRKRLGQGTFSPELISRVENLAK